MDGRLRAAVRAYRTDPTNENAHRVAREVTRCESAPPTRKILISRGFGAGWTTWASHDGVAKLMLDWPPLIDALERGERVAEDHPAVGSLREEITRLYGADEVPYLGGIDGLTVVKVEPPFRVTEYDGAEGVQTLSDLTWD